MANTAHIYKSKSGNWNISFHHPICRKGSIGKKIHRSLKVSEEPQAQALRRQMDELLKLAETPSLLPTRSHAIAEQKIRPVVIDAFFDCMTPEPVDYLALRERAMPLPPKTGKKGPLPHVLLAGPTGAGKSRLMQHLLGTTLWNFPMRGAGRTTVADTETIVDDVDFAAVLTFYTESEIRETIKENILEACAFAHRNKEDKAKIASKLLVDSDKRFRFNFILGGWTQNAEAAADHEYEFEGEEEEEESDLEAEAGAPAPSWPKLDSCLAQIVSMAEHAFEAARRELQPAGEQDEPVVEEYWLQYIDQDQLDALAEEILEELEKRLCAATGQASWPVLHRIADTKDEGEFFRRLRPFYQNNRKFFGTLVTPLVQGIRVRGRFAPPPWASKNAPAWVLLDGQGIGHEQGGATKINQTVPPELARKFSSADLICLVDRSVPAMTGDAPILLEHLIVRGHQERLALIFTHFENVSAPDLDWAGRKAKVLEGLSNAIQSIASLPKAQRVLLERTAESKTYFLARLDQSEIKYKSTQAELKRICDHFKRSAGEPEIPKFRPRYNEFKIANVLRRAIESYRQDWSEGELASYHWKIMEALTNWIGNARSDGYPKRNLYPGQDLSRRLVAAISIELESPSAWEPYKPESAEEESRILNAVRIKVGDRVDGYCREVLVRDPRTGFWLPAYEKISGPGTKVLRARTVARILEDRAQLPSEGIGKFTKDVWRKIQETIAEVCSLDEAKKEDALD
jgi:hypothetical protein